MTVSRRIVFDVGANDGATSIPWASQGDTVYAFEPTPQLAAALRQRTAHLANYHVVEAAVSNVPGRRLFHVAGWEDWGCSSLRERTAYADTAFRMTWPSRQEFPVTATLEVEVIRLEEFVDGHGVGRIDYLHVDTQGEDLQVLCSLRIRIADVQAGVIEVATSPAVAIYEGMASFDEAADFLDKHGFQILQAVPNYNSHELNVSFERS